MIFLLMILITNPKWDFSEACYLNQVNALQCCCYFCLAVASLSFGFQWPWLPGEEIWEKCFWNGSWLQETMEIIRLLLTLLSFLLYLSSTQCHMQIQAKIYYILISFCFIFYIDITWIDRRTSSYCFES